jgi:hypothetical protein
MRVLAFLVLLIGAAAWASDPNQATTLEGYVTAPGPACLQGVAITVDSNTRAMHFETKTYERGYYRFADLPPGAYTVCADARSEGCILIPRLVLNHGEHARQDFHFSKIPKKTNCDNPTAKAGLAPK